jgi:hypothetical protein
LINFKAIDKKEGMLRFGSGGKLKPRKFDFTPRYYDEAKDNLESRIEKYGEGSETEELLKERIKLGIRQKYYADSSFRDKETKKSNLRLFYVMIILFFISYMILKSDKIAKLMEYLNA